MEEQVVLGWRCPKEKYYKGNIRNTESKQLHLVSPSSETGLIEVGA